ncbi:hypothetical protein P8625_06905 [Tenacibaculum tangerinum]|uniref:Ecotin n=1 Tax=Tenacibaculum tangerinum TaxID=3038772 RepID=A0ABY8LA31_9FLAO|nr:hypothetical protein [Tenacibaculum tangerinum]WGH76865.1 hypothetical protein P8625_06905 [Tenacibaculum tangerinum]
MKKSILNLGKALNKTSQKQINGGYPAIPDEQKCKDYCLYERFDGVFYLGCCSY